MFAERRRCDQQVSKTFYLLITYVSQLFPNLSLQSDAVKYANNSLDLYALTSCSMFREDNLFSARLAGISAKSSENCRRYNFQAVANISRNFRRTFSALLYQQQQMSSLLF